MAKKQVMISLDSALHEKAKDKKLNISSICEESLRQVMMTYEQTTLPENCDHKWTWPFAVPFGLARECKICGFITKVKMESYQETMERARKLIKT